jgi:hypothetical protein
MDHSHFKFSVSLVKFLRTFKGLKKTVSDQSRMKSNSISEWLLMIR